jgi:hypothetical protein
MCNVVGLSTSGVPNKNVEEGRRVCLATRETCMQANTDGFRRIRIRSISLGLGVDKGISGNMW